VESVARGDDVTNRRKKREKCCQLLSKGRRPSIRADTIALALQPAPVRHNVRVMTASVQRFRFQYPDKSIKKGRACNEAKTKNKKARGRAERRRTSGG